MCARAMRWCVFMMWIPCLHAQCSPGYLYNTSSIAVLSDLANHVIYTYDVTNNILTPIAGTFGTPGYMNGVNSLLNTPSKAVLTPDGTGVLFADTNNMVIRKVDIASRSVSTVVGTKYTFGVEVSTIQQTAVDGVGSAASFYKPQYIQFSNDSSKFYVSTEYFQIVRRVTYPGFVTSTILGTVMDTWGSADGILGAGGSLLRKCLLRKCF